MVVNTRFFELQDIQTLEEEQLARQLRAEKRAEETHRTNERKLKQIGKESALIYGRKLYGLLVDDLSSRLNKTFLEFVENPDKARFHGAAIPFFDPFKSPEHVATIALVATLDQLSRRQRIATFCQGLGAAVEKEIRLMRLADKSPVELRHLMKQGLSRNKISTMEIMRKMGCPVLPFNDLSRLHIGQFLLDHLIHTGLIKVIKRKIGRTTPRFVIPTDHAEKIIKSCPPSTYKVAYSALVSVPYPWPGLYGGGRPGNEECFVRVPIHDAEEKDTTAIEHYRKADLTKTFVATNHLQATPLHVKRDIIECQRNTWENGTEGLWPCAKVPLDVPERLGQDPAPEDLKIRNRLASMAHRDREQNRPRRIKIERALQEAEGLADRTVYQAYHADHRSRLYTSNKYVSHQGPDYEKAMLDFAEKLPVNDEAFDWLLKGAAGHYGYGRKSWDERLSWGRKNIDLMKAAAEDPLERLELWRNANDPWQFLQACKGVKEVLETGRTGCPVRFDQTTSGCGILAALLRSEKVGKECNLFGDERRDLYTLVAEKVTERLVHDLQFGEERDKALAQIWLQKGINRSLCKQPILAAPYGGSYMSLCDSLVERLDEHLGYVPLENFTYEVAIPAKYLASHLWDETKQRIKPCLEFKKWLHKVTRKVMSKGHALEWTTQSGWPMRIADREPQIKRIQTMLFGKHSTMNIKDQPKDAPLCATQANKGIAANFTHSWDSAFCINFVYKAVEQNIQVLTNHDCFAVHAANAGVAHKTLHDTFNELYAPNWLVGFVDEVQLKTGISLPDMPKQGSLNPRLIGTNPYLFS